MSSAASILLVDDDRHLAESMAQWLREMSHEVETAESLGKQRSGCPAGRLIWSSPICDWVTRTALN